MADFPHTFPMVRAGGLFIVIMGVSVVCGGLFPGQRKLLLALGGVTATLAIGPLCAVLGVGVVINAGVGG